MNEMNEKHILVGLNDPSDLKIRLNQGVASLFDAKEYHLQPHVCLNGKEGIEVLKKIANNPEKASTEFWISSNPIIAPDGIWLNIHFIVFLDKISFPDNTVSLSPRQTVLVVQNLTGLFLEVVIEAVKEWSLEKEIPRAHEALKTISKQIEDSKCLTASAYHNRVLDIQDPGSGRGAPYTEMEIIEKKLIMPFLFGIGRPVGDNDPYAKIDEFLLSVQREHERGLGAEILVVPSY